MERPTSSIIHSYAYVFRFLYFLYLTFIIYYLSLCTCACFDSLCLPWGHLRWRRTCKSLDREFSILWIRGLRHPIPRLHFPSLISVYHAVLCTTHPLSTAPPELRYYFGVASAGSMHTQRRRSRVIYDYAREHDKPRHGGQKVDTTREGYASRRPVLSWIDRYIDALAPVAPESVDLSSPIALLPRGS